MSILATTTVAQDGALHASMILSGVCDGSGGDENLAVKVDPTTFVTQCQKVNLDWIQYEVSGGIVSLFWETYASGPLKIMDLATRGEFNIGMEKSASLAPPADATGRILLSTVGFDAGSSYTLNMRLRKKQIGPIPTQDLWNQAPKRYVAGDSPGVI